MELHRVERVAAVTWSKKSPLVWRPFAVLLLALALGGCDLFMAPPAPGPPAEIGDVAPLDPQLRDSASAAKDAADATNQRELIGRVVRVADGDTLTVADSSGRQYKIRLFGIDAPELKQPFGRQSRQALSTATRDKTVHVRWHERDQYDRILGDVYVGDLDVNEQQVRGGWAWKYIHSRDPTLATAEQAARGDRVGLWSEANPTPPWEFRRTVGQRATRR